MTVVLDASVAIRWLFEDEKSDAADAVFRHVHRSGAHVPGLFAAEIGNALIVGLRRRRITEADLAQGTAVIRSLPIALDDVQVQRVLHEVTPLARRHELSVYDALYLELAMRLNLPLATFDTRLSTAAERSGVQLWHGPLS